MFIWYTLFYGFLITALLGLFASWVDRKVTAMVQYRVGPPFLQPLMDLIKLLGKETLVPAGASKTTFFLAPLLGLSSVILVSSILWMNTLHPHKTFIGDLIVVVYLLIIPSVSLIMGAMASKNPLASMGASREIKLILSYELPFLLAVFVPVIQAGLSLRLGNILEFQAQQGMILGTWSGALALLVAILCIHAKLGWVPFDMAEAETELAGGVLVDYSGAALAVFRLMKNMMLFTLPFFLMILFLGGVSFQGMHALGGFFKYLGLVAVLTVIRNTNPRIRVDHAVKFFWGPLTLLALAAVVLAFKGF